MKRNHDYYYVSYLENIVIEDIKIARKLRDAINEALHGHIDNHEMEEAKVISVDDSDSDIESSFLVVK